jgi:hypothetical protein
VNLTAPILGECLASILVSADSAAVILSGHGALRQTEIAPGRVKTLMNAMGSPNRSKNTHQRCLVWDSGCETQNEAPVRVVWKSRRERFYTGSANSGHSHSEIFSQKETRSKTGFRCSLKSSNSQFMAVFMASGVYQIGDV